MKKISNTAKRLNYILNYKGLKQADLVRQTNLPKSAISQYLSGKVEPKQDNLYIIAEALNVSEAWLMGYDTEMKKTISSNIINLSNQEKALINKYRQLNEQQQYKVMGYIDSELHYNETAKESTPIYKIDNNTHLMVAEQDYTPGYVEARKLAYGAKQDEKFFVDKKAYDKVEEEEKRDLEQLNSDEELVLQNLMKSTGKTKEECYEIMKEILGLH